MKNTIILLLLLTFSSTSFAFKFSPMSATINYNEESNTTLFYLENDSDLPIAIQVSIASREMNNMGLETNKVVKEDFSFYPSQMIIPANEKRSVKVTYTGKEKPKKELAYRLIAEQLPIDLEKSSKNKKSIKVLLRYVAALYISDDSFKSAVELKSFSVEKGNLRLLFANTGNKHQILSNLSLSISAQKNKKTYSFKAQELPQISGENILSYSERVFSLPLKGDYSNIQSTDKAKINFDQD